MSQIPTPPASRPGSEAPGLEGKPDAEHSSDLLQSLDALLEQYLHLLDRQQQLQSGISKQMSSGFLALAHANYTCPPGRRYGSDYYDERMKATGKISIQEKHETSEDDRPTDSHEADSLRPDDFKYQFSLQRVSNHEADEQAHTTEQGEAEKPSTELSTTSPDNETPATPKEEDIAESSDFKQEPNAESPPKENKAVRKKFRSEDPIHWYGILVPPSLRTAQKSFTDAIQSPVPELAGVVVEMRTLEQKIDELRAKLKS